MKFNSWIAFCCKEHKELERKKKDYEMLQRVLKPFGKHVITGSYIKETLPVISIHYINNVIKCLLSINQKVYVLRY